MFRRFSKLLSLFAFIVLFSGCHFVPPATGYSSHDFEVCGPATKEEIRGLDKALDVLPEAMVDSIMRVSAQPEKHFTTVPGEVAHVMMESGAGICFSPGYLDDPEVIWHEAAHCYENHLIATGRLFSIRWKMVAGDVYDDGTEYRISQALGTWFVTRSVKRGVLTTYGRTNPHEDVAEFTGEVYKFLAGGYSQIQELKKTGLFSSDTRYRKKLGLLHEYGFLNDEDYRKVLDFLK